MKKVINFYWDKEVNRGYFYLETSAKDKVFGEHTETKRLEEKFVAVLGFKRENKVSYAEHVTTTIQSLIDKGYGLSIQAQRQFDYWRNRFAGEELEKENRRKVEELEKQNREIKTERESKKWQTYIY